MTPKLSPRTKELVDAIFPAENVKDAIHWLEDECGNAIPFCENNDEFQMERIRFAAIKLSNGNIDFLLKAIDEAKIDWRDLFMAAGFGYKISAHEKWAEEILKNT